MREKKGSRVFICEVVSVIFRVGIFADNTEIIAENIPVFFLIICKIILKSKKIRDVPFSV